jgi:2-dehydropantoate 2-reductase
MRVVIVGVGAVGGTVAARLALAGYDVLAVARGAHGEAIREHGLLFESPTESQRVTMPVATRVGEAGVRAGDVVLLGMKAQDTSAVLAELRLTAPRDTPIVCLQNGVDNERQALRLFAHVYGVCVMLPADHLEPGRVRVYTSPTPGILDLGRYPHGTDTVVDELAAAFSASGFESVARPDIMRWKYRKLLMNLGNAIEALVGGFASWPSPSELMALVAAEGEAVLAAAGIDVVSEEEDRARRGDVLRIRPVDGVRRDGGSTYQSLQRGTPVETDYLTGEIVLLGRLHGVPTPANALLQRILAEAAARGEAPAGHTEDELLAALGNVPTLP